MPTQRPGFASSPCFAPGVVLSLSLLAAPLACQPTPPQTAQLPQDAPSSARSVEAPAAAARPAVAGEVSPLSVGEGAAASSGSWPAADFVVAANLDGEGGDELVFSSGGSLSIWAAGDAGPYELILPQQKEEPNLPGAPTVSAVADLDGDGREDVLLAYGMTRGALEVPITLAALRVKGESGQHRRVIDILARVTSSRPDPAGIVVADLVGDNRPEILFAYYDSKYFVTAQALLLANGPDPLAGPLVGSLFTRVRMGASWAAAPLEAGAKARVAVGRPYGEEKLTPGDLALVQGEKRELIPTSLGVRAVAFGDADQDGVLELFFGDGWHFDYGKKARGRLSMARLVDGRWLTELIEDSPGQYEIKQIEVLDIDGDGRTEVLTAGSAWIRLYWSEGRQWMVRPLARGTAFAFARVGSGPSLVVPGSPTKLIPLQEGRVGGQPVSRAVSPPGSDRVSSP